jgi:hypothetical protein
MLTNLRIAQAAPLTCQLEVSLAVVLACSSRHGLQAGGAAGAPARWLSKVLHALPGAANSPNLHTHPNFARVQAAPLTCQLEFSLAAVLAAAGDALGAITVLERTLAAVPACLACGHEVQLQVRSLLQGYKL